MEWSILLLSDCAFLPYCPVILMIYMLGCAFFIIPIAHTRVLVFRTAVCFLMWILVTCGILVTCECFSMCSLNHPYVFSLTATHTSLQGSVTWVHWPCCGIGQWHGLQGVWFYTSLPSCADTLYLFGHPAICIVRTEPQAPIRMVTLTIYCLKDKLGILCVHGNYPQAAEGL